jgi:hypothetical protein
MLIYEDYMQLFICQSCVEAGVCAAFGRVAGWLVSFPIRAEHPIGLRPDMPRIRRKCLIWLSILTLARLGIPSASPYRASHAGRAAAPSRPRPCL